MSACCRSDLDGAESAQAKSSRSSAGATACRRKLAVRAVLGHARELIEPGQAGVDGRRGAEALGQRGLDALRGISGRGHGGFPVEDGSMLPQCPGPAPPAVGIIESESVS